jgi:cytochrome c553
LRRGDNIAEAYLWGALKARKLGGYKSAAVLAALEGRLSDDTIAPDMRFVFAARSAGEV